MNTTQTTTISDLFVELHWTAPSGADLTGYTMEAYFDADVHAAYPSREAAVDAALLAYRGADEHGVGLDLSRVAPSLDGDGRAIAGVPTPGYGPVYVDPRPRLVGSRLRQFRADLQAARSEAEIWAAHARARA